MAEANIIRIKGARQHNLRNLDIEIPRNKLVVITGLSGSGKSSLAFDTLYAEGQRKYVESLSAYARQFLDQMQKPDVDYIEGLSPAIAIEQRTAAANPRSTIATTTEIYDYLRLLYSAAGKPHDPNTGEPILRQTPQQIADEILTFGEDARIVLMAPLIDNEAGEFRDVIEKAKREGFVRVRVDGEIHELNTPEPIRMAKTRKHVIEVVIDRLIIKEGIEQRLSDSIELALKWGRNRLVVLLTGKENTSPREIRFSTDFCNPRTGYTLPKLTPKHFSFNSHLGACPACQGLGVENLLDPDLMVDLAKTLKDGAVRPWRKGTAKMLVYYSGILESLAREYSAPMDKPFENLPQAFKEALFQGTGDRAIEVVWGTTTKRTRTTKPFEGLVTQLARLYETTESEFTKNRLRSFMSQHQCQVCLGTRLKPEILAVTLSTTSGEQYNVHQFCALAVKDAVRVAAGLKLTATELDIVTEVMREIRERLHFLEEVGLGYLSLNRESGTLSGGEAQRIRLATQIGSGLAGVLYVLDEPSIGLHQRDNDRLIGTLKRLRDLGNTVIVVEHDEDTIRAADYILDLGPGAGPRGGHIVAQGTLDEVMSMEASLTAQYLSGAAKIPIPRVRVTPRKSKEKGAADGDGWLTVQKAAENNLDNVTAAFPIGCLTCVSGVSGSGKSTLVNDILQRSMFRHLYRSKEKPGVHKAIAGMNQIDKAIVIDQDPIGRTPRSNPATYTGALSPIRDLFSQLPSARIRGYDAGRFSFNVKGGRCEHCEGDGFLKIDMHFLADVYVECEICHGKRYNRETLEITYKGKNIADILAMTVDEAARFFRNIPAIADKLTTLQDVGLGYVHLGQSATTLSGGEAQRIKLAAELAKRSTGRTLYILDEPTTGLHLADIHTLLDVLMKLRNSGNTLVVIEHNLHVLKCADWLIDLGPGGGSEGGKIIAEGTPEEVAANAKSVTGHYLKEVMKR